MKVLQYKWTKESEWQPPLKDISDNSSQLVLVFGSRGVIEKSEELKNISSVFPKAQIVGCSTAGEIIDDTVEEETLIATAINFEKTTLKIESVEVEGIGGSFGAGKILAERLSHPELSHVLIISPGLDINGGDLIQGLSSILPSSVDISGGLSGDGVNFEKTIVIDRENISENSVVGIGLLGSDVSVHTSSFGGWSAFGPERAVTKSEGSVLYELDNQSALELYKKYLGDHAKDLPASGLLFPLSIKTPGSEETLVRTILAVDQEDQSITFAGDVPKGAVAQFMKANNDDLIEGANQAALNLNAKSMSFDPKFAMLVSCVGRRLVLKQRAEEEIEAVKDVLGDGVSISGFYSYGEISPFETNGKSQLHNQTMTITLIGERE